MARLLLAFVALLMGLAAPAEAHLTPNSELGLDFGRSRIDASLIVPLGELQYAEPQFADLRPGSPTAAQRALLTGWLLRHMAATAPDGQHWRLSLTTVRISDDAAPDLLARISMMPPEGAPLRSFTLAYSGLIDRLPNHFVLVMLRTDFDAGHLSERPAMLGGLRHGAETVLIDRGPGSGWRGFKGAIGLGMNHIAQGHDHLLFLFALLLPAPLLAEAGRWRHYGGARKTVRALAAIVTAFTIGHSMTLIGGAFLGWQLPARPVEVLIALSILISAVHALRPLFAGREALVAGGFGLVHGMAFATVIGRFGLEPWQKAQSILGFNLGIELIQLLVVALTVPGLVMLARTRFYPRFRAGMAIATGIAAAIWMAERIGGHELAAGRAIDAALDYSPWVLAAAAAGALIALIVGRLLPGPATA
jgi:hypothetical protein